MKNIDADIYNLQQDILACRDCLRPIVEGVINRETSVPGRREYHAGQRGTRKVTLKDARKIADHVVWKINRALDDFENATE